MASFYKLVDYGVHLKDPVLQKRRDFNKNVVTATVKTIKAAVQDFFLFPSSSGYYHAECSASGPRYDFAVYAYSRTMDAATPP